MDAFAARGLFGRHANHKARRKLKMPIDRRSVIFGLPLLMTGCAEDQPLILAAEAPAAYPYASIYAAIDTEPFPVPAIDLTEIKPQFLRQEVGYATTES